MLSKYKIERRKRKIAEKFIITNIDTCSMKDLNYIYADYLRQKKHDRFVGKMFGKMFV